jgi:signal transduction histidine kinase
MSVQPSAHTRPRRRLQTRLMATFAAFTLAVSALFALFAMVFVYTVEDQFLERQLEQEAARQQAHHRQHGTYTAPASDFITVHTRRDTLPPEVATLLAEEPSRREVAGEQGRHYHLLPLVRAGEPPWLVAEVSGQLIVRPMRTELFTWLAAWGAVAVALSLGLAAWLARRTSAPLEALSAQVAHAAPEQLPQQLAGATRGDEVGALARSFGALLDRTRHFITREQAFTRDASHELRTPLAVLRMGLERLIAAPGTPPALRQELAPLHAATTLMEQTVHTLLLLARESGDGAAPPTPATAVLPLVEQWALAHAGWLDQQALTLDVQLRRDDRLPLPPAVLQLVVASLLGNALAHGERGGRVQVRLDPHGALLVANPGAEPPPGAGQDGVKGEASAGFGLGLSIVRRLLEQHGARLEIAHHQGHTQVRVAAPG